MRYLSCVLVLCLFLSTSLADEKRAARGEVMIVMRDGSIRFGIWDGPSELLLATRQGPVTVPVSMLQQIELAATSGEESAHRKKQLRLLVSQLADASWSARESAARTLRAEGVGARSILKELREGAGVEQGKRMDALLRVTARSNGESTEKVRGDRYLGMSFDFHCWKSHPPMRVRLSGRSVEVKRSAVQHIVWLSAPKATVKSVFELRLKDRTSYPVLDERATLLVEQGEARKRVKLFALHEIVFREDRWRVLDAKQKSLGKLVGDKLTLNTARGVVSVSFAKLSRLKRHTKLRAQEPSTMNTKHGRVEAWGSFDGKSYVVMDRSVTWFEASQIAGALGGQLPSIRSEDENSYLAKLLSFRGEASWWLGLTDEATEGKWRWLDGRVPGFTNWYHGEPNNYENNEDHCQFWGRTGWWNDVRASSECRVVVVFDQVG